MPDELPLSAARAWAEQQLGLDAACDTADIQRALWTRLAETDFANHGSHIEAIDILLHPVDAASNPRSTPQFRRDYEQALSSEIAAFAGRFFEINPSDRRALWSSLIDRAAACPKLHWRLKRLQTGLAVDFENVRFNNAQATAVAAWCGDLFVLPPQLRSARKLEILAQLQTEPSREMATAAKQVRKLAPDIAALARDLVDEIADRQRLAKRRARASQSLVRRQKWHRSRRSAPIVVMWAVILITWTSIAMQFGKSGPRPQPRVPDRPQGMRNLTPQNRGAPVTIDAEELLASGQPLQKLAELNNAGPVHVRATPDQLRRLRQQMGEALFRLCFGNGIGDGMSKIVESDNRGSATTDPADLESTAPLELFKSQSQENSGQPPPIVTIDADELLDSTQSPTHRLVMLALRQGLESRSGGGAMQKVRIQVRATADQLRRLKELLSESQFLVCFGHGSAAGMAELVETDKLPRLEAGEVPPNE